MSDQKPTNSTTKKTFKPFFKGHFKLFLHDDVPDRLADRAEFTGDWQAGQKRGRIMKRDRKFQVALYIFDTDGYKRGHNVMLFENKGGQRELSKVVFMYGNDFIDELISDFNELNKLNDFKGVNGFDDFVVDLTNSYAVVKA